jgi:hypothetical protein
VAGLILWEVDSIYQLDQEMCLEALQAVNSVKSSPADCHISRFKTTDVPETDFILCSDTVGHLAYPNYISAPDQGSW